MAVTKRTRYEVLKRDNFTCRYCRSADNAMTIDHVVPTALDGSDSPDNLVAACKDCNAGKSSSHPDAHLVADVKQDAVRWAAAMKQATATMLIQQQKRDEYVAEVYNIWSKYGEERYFDDDAEATIMRWWRDGVPLEFVTDAVFIAWGRRYLDKWRVMAYIAGIVKNKMTEAHERAAELLEAEEASDGS